MPTGRTGGAAARAPWLATFLVVVVGCAYFNTFYNAREHFKKAERAQQNVSTETGPTAAAIREYDLTIDKCNKVIQEHEGSRWVDDAVLLMGRAYFGKREYAQALDKFRALVDGFPRSDLRAEALFMTGLTYYRLNRREEGRQTFDQLLRESPRFARRDEMLRIQAEALERDGEVEAAIAIYRSIVADYPESDRRVETLLDIGDLYMRTGVFDSAYVAFDAALREASQIEDRFAARRRRADALFREKRYEEALETYRTVLDVGTNLAREEIEPIEIRIAACVAELGDHDRAIEEYRRIAESSSGDIAAAEALFNIGLVLELDFGDYKAAVDEYDAIPRLQGAGARSIFATQAASRAKQLRKLISQGILTREDQAKGGAGAGALLLAEQFLYQQADTLAAIEQYARVEADYPNTPEAAKAAYAQAFLKELTGAPADTTEPLWVRVLTEYPGTPQAIGAGDQLTKRGLEHLIPEGALVPAPRDTASVADTLATDEVSDGPQDTPERSVVVADSSNVVRPDSLPPFGRLLPPGLAERRELLRALGADSLTADSLGVRDSIGAEGKEPGLD